MSLKISSEALRVRPPTPEVIARAMSLLQSVVEHKKANMRGVWWRTLYPISHSPDIRIGKPDVRDDEVQLLLAANIVTFIDNSRDPEIPDSVLRLLHDDEARAEDILRRYVDSLEEAPHP